MITATRPWRNLWSREGRIEEELGAPLENGQILTSDRLQHWGQQGPSAQTHTSEKLEDMGPKDSQCLFFALRSISFRYHLEKKQPGEGCLTGNPKTQHITEVTVQITISLFLHRDLKVSSFLPLVRTHKGNKITINTVKSIFFFTNPSYVRFSMHDIN